MALNILILFSFHCLPLMVNNPGYVYLYFMRKGKVQEIIWLNVEIESIVRGKLTFSCFDYSIHLVKYKEKIKK